MVYAAPYFFWEKMIKFKNVGVVYPGGVKALDAINLEINQGDFVIIVGLSGAGKSTLLRSINNLVKPTSGTVYVCLLYTSPSPRD